MTDIHAIRRAILLKEIAATKAACLAFRDLLWQARLALLLRYDPDQPRVPAGSPEGGRWTSGDGGSLYNVSDNARRYPENIDSDPYLNRHIIDGHVGKTDEELQARIRREQIRGLFAHLGRDRNGSFDSIESARDFIRLTLDDNHGMVARVARGEEPDAFVTTRFGYHTGREAILDEGTGAIRMRPTYMVGVAIEHDSRNLRGYRIISAYPRNYNERIGR